MEQKLKQKS